MTPKPELEWMIMLYLAGDNDLSPEMIRALSDIEAVGVPNKVAITIQYDPVAPSLPTLRYYLVPGSKPIPHEGPFPLGKGEPVIDGENSADPRTLRKFIHWSLRKCRARYRMLILSGHGAGAVGEFLSDYDVPGRQRRALSIKLLYKALEQAKGQATGGISKFDDDPPGQEDFDGPAGKKHIEPSEPLVHILGMDSCLMNMAEVAYELHREKDPLVTYLVGSEGYMPNAGWPYGYLLKKLRGKIEEKPAHSPKKRARVPLDPVSMSGYLVEDIVEFYKSYVPAAVSVDVSACELKMLDRVAAELQKLTKLLGPGLDDPSIRNMVILAHWWSQSFKLEQCTDLWDFCDRLQDFCESQNEQPQDEQLQGKYRQGAEKPDCHAIATACGLLKTAIDGAFKSEGAGGKPRQCFAGVDFQYARGLSVYFPWRLTAIPKESWADADRPEFPELKPYRELRFPKAVSGWNDFLEKYLDRTMRPMKDIGCQTAEEDAVSGSAIVMRGAGQAGQKYSPDKNRFSPDRNRFSPDKNRFVTELFGNTLPWSMKNPPQQVQAGRPVKAEKAKGRGGQDNVGE